MYRYIGNWHLKNLQNHKELLTSWKQTPKLAPAKGQPQRETALPAWNSAKSTQNMTNKSPQTREGFLMCQIYQSELKATKVPNFDVKIRRSLRSYGSIKSTWRNEASWRIGHKTACRWSIITDVRFGELRAWNGEKTSPRGMFFFFFFFMRFLEQQIRIWSLLPAAGQQMDSTALHGVFWLLFGWRKFTCSFMERGDLMYSGLSDFYVIQLNALRFEKIIWLLYHFLFCTGLASLLCQTLI